MKHAFVKTCRLKLINTTLACSLVDLNRSLYYYHLKKPKLKSDAKIISRILILRERHRAIGAKKIAKLLSMKTKPINHKRVARILKENDMTVVQKKKRKRIENLLRIPLTNEMKQSKGIWSIDFMCGRKNNKFKFMLLNVINIGSRISPIMCVERSFTSFDVTYELEKGFVIDGKPSRIILIMGLNLQVHILKFGAKETISFII
jgi:hypothetical protein